MSDKLADERGLEKIKTVGDAYMVSGGIPVSRRDHAEAVADMAVAMRDEIAALAEATGFPLSSASGSESTPGRSWPGS